MTDWNLLLQSIYDYQRTMIRDHGREHQISDLMMAEVVDRTKGRQASCGVSDEGVIAFWQERGISAASASPVA